MKKISKKKMSAIFSTVCVSALIVAGTFAWSEMKNVQNEFDKTINISAELRDDFDPKTGNKDVYIENTGNTPLYARMKLNEYMEIYNIVDDQFESIKDPTYSANKNQEGSATIKTIAENQWTTHIGDVNDGQICTNPTSGDVTFHDFYSWKMGGTTTTTLKDATEEYPTPDANVISMQAWKEGGLTQGETWVLDTDGYIYYAKAIAPETTTGLLLDAVNLIKKPEANFYYGIDAIMEVVSEDDVVTMINGGKTAMDETLTKASDDASELLRTIASYIKITDEMNKTTPPAKDFDDDNDGYLDRSESEAYDRALGYFKDAEGNMYRHNGNNTFTQVDENKTEIIPSNIIYGGDNKKPDSTDEKVIKGADNQYYIPRTNNVFQKVEDDGTLKYVSGGPDLQPGSNDETKKDIIKDGNNYLIDNTDGTYQAIGTDGNLDTADDIKNLTKITEKMSATTPSANDFDKTLEGYLTESELNAYKAVAPLETVTIGGIEWIVLSKDEKLGQAELLSSKILFTRLFHGSQPYPGWENSSIRTYLNGDYYNSLSPELKDSIVKVTKRTNQAYNNSAQVVTEDFIYLLSETEAKELSAKYLKCENASGVNAVCWWLRSPRGSTSSAGLVNRTGGSFHSAYVVNTPDGVRPALTVKYK